MNCTEFKIWTETASESGILLAENEILEHAKSCNNCNRKLLALQDVFRFMNYQKSLQFSDIKSKELIEKLSVLSQQENFVKIKKGYTLSKLAVAAVIIFGILTGAFAGGLFNSESTTENALWSNEFNMLSENSGAQTIVFE